MIRYKIKCRDCNRNFDSWFASSIEFDRIKNFKLLTCSHCNSLNVEKSLMAPNLKNTKKNLIKNDNEKIKVIKNKLKQYQKFIEKNYNYVGENFAYEARSIHYSNNKKNKNNKGIFGKASSEEIKELNDEGIEIDSIPWIDNKKN